MAQRPIQVAMTPPHPGSFIRSEILEPLGLNITDAAEVLRVRRATVSDLLNEKTSLSPEMALRIEKAFGVDMGQMLQMQVWHDACRMRARAGEIKVKPFTRQKRTARA